MWEENLFCAWNISRNDQSAQFDLSREIVKKFKSQKYFETFCAIKGRLSPLINLLNDTRLSLWFGKVSPCKNYELLARKRSINLIKKFTVTERRNIFRRCRWTLIEYSFIVQEILRRILERQSISTKTKVYETIKAKFYETIEHFPTLIHAKTMTSCRWGTRREE